MRKFLGLGVLGIFMGMGLLYISTEDFRVRLTALDTNNKELTEAYREFAKDETALNLYINKLADDNNYTRSQWPMLSSLIDAAQPVSYEIFSKVSGIAQLSGVERAQLFERTLRSRSDNTLPNDMFEEAVLGTKDKSTRSAMAQIYLQEIGKSNPERAMRSFDEWYSRKIVDDEVAMFPRRLLSGMVNQDENEAIEFMNACRLSKKAYGLGVAASVGVALANKEGEKFVDFLPLIKEKSVRDTVAKNSIYILSVEHPEKLQRVYARLPAGSTWKAFIAQSLLQWKRLPASEM